MPLATHSTEITAIGLSRRPRPGLRPEPSARLSGATWPPSTVGPRMSSSDNSVGATDCGWGGGGADPVGPAGTSPGRTGRPGTTITGTRGSQTIISKMKTA